MHNKKKKIFWTKHYECKVCPALFDAKFIRTEYLTRKETHTDFHIIYEGEENPLFYQLVICPDCLTALRRRDFDGLRDRDIEKLIENENERKQIAGKFDYNKPRDFPLSVKGYELGAASYQAIGRKSDIIAGMYIRAAWLARDFKKEPLEKHYLTLALKYYRMAYEKENVMAFGKFGEAGLIYIIADLSLGLGRIQDALRFYSRVVEHSDIKRFRELERMARDGWMKVKELRGNQPPQRGQIKT